MLLDLQTHFLQVKAISESDNFNNYSLDQIQLLSKHSLMMMDYYLFSIDYLQTELPLTTVSAAAVALDVAENLRRLARAYDVCLDLDITQKLEPVYANESALKGILYGLASSLIIERQESKKVRVVIAAQETAPNIQRLGVYSPDVNMSPTSIKQSRILAGQARAAAPLEISSSGLGLMLSDQLTHALGSKIMRFTHRGQKGVGFYVPMSSQLSFL